MGKLTNNLIDILYLAEELNAVAPENSKEAWVAFGFRIKGGAEEKRLVLTDEQCVEATAEKIKGFRERDGVMPEEVFWIA